jgi:hypothetical protein
VASRDGIETATPSSSSSDSVLSTATAIEPDSVLSTATAIEPAASEPAATEPAASEPATEPAAPLLSNNKLGKRTMLDGQVCGVTKQGKSWKLGMLCACRRGISYDAAFKEAQQMCVPSLRPRIIIDVSGHRPSSTRTDGLIPMEEECRRLVEVKRFVETLPSQKTKLERHYKMLVGGFIARPGLVSKGLIDAVFHHDRKEPFDQQFESRGGISPSAPPCLIVP